MTHLAYDPEIRTLPVDHTFNGIRIGFMGMYDLGFWPMDDAWIISAGHPELEAFIRAANDLHEHERYGRPFDQTSDPAHLWAINLAECPDLYTCENKICKKYGSWQLYADWFALWTDGDEEFTADTPGAMPVTILNPFDWSASFRKAREEEERRWSAENPSLAF